MTKNTNCEPTGIHLCSTGVCGRGLGTTTQIKSGSYLAEILPELLGDQRDASPLELEARHKPAADSESTFAVLDRDCS